MSASIQTTGQTTAQTTAQTRAQNASRRVFDIAVVGAGLFGSAAARYLSQDGEGIALIGPREPADRRAHRGVFASHHDASRLIRIVDPDLVWATLARRSIAQFRALEARSGREFFREVGYLMVTPGGLGTDWFDFPAMRAVASDLRVDLDTLDGDALRRRFPELRFTPESAGLLQRSDAGYIDPRKLLHVQQSIALAQGTSRIDDEVVELRHEAGQVELRTRDDTRIRANRVLVATGASTNASRLLGRTLVTTVRAAMVMLAEVRRDTRLDIPTILYAKTDGAAPFLGLLMPPSDTRTAAPT